MQIKKRNGKSEKVNLNKITQRIRGLKFIEAIDTEPLNIDETLVAAKVASGLFDGVLSVELDNLAAETAAGMTLVHPDYDKLAARIEISSLHKETTGNFEDNVVRLNAIGIISDEYKEYVTQNKWISKGIDYNRDFNIDYFGIRTLKRSYLMRNKDKKIIERPQDMWMRVASYIHQKETRGLVYSTYNELSNKLYTHATPTLFNAGTVKPQLSSCFLLDMADDSIDGIYKTLSDCAKISQSAGGIGVAIHKIRGQGSYIKGTGGYSNGIVPMLRNFDMTARYVDQGGGRRKGSFAMYIEPWHSDIFSFLELKKNHGKEEMRARDLFYGLWIPDLFMRRVRENASWTLFDPAEAGGLLTTYGDEFEKLYLEYESKNAEQLQGANKTIKARDLWDKIIESQIETGTPYMLYKDAVNNKCNQKNLGVIKSSNLCTEITEFTSPDETAVCNLASISLPAFVSKRGIEYTKLYNIAKRVTKNLNNVIDLNYYPVIEAKNSNTRHRPIGIGVQGLADLYAKLRIAFDSDEAKSINKRIFETIYKGAVDESIELAKEQGAYESYEGSPAFNGQLQFDLWGIDRSTLSLDWTSTFENLKLHGLRNSLLLAPMPTASTAQILGNNEAFEPFTSNIYTRRTLSGEFIVINKWLIRELIELNLWNHAMKQQIIAGNGSIQAIDQIPVDIRYRYRTVWEMSMKDILDMSADRGAFVCQSQSLNIFMNNPTASKLSSMHFYGWEKGLKTGMYYLRSKSAVDAIKFTITKEEAIPKNDPIAEAESQFDCIGCGS